MIRLGAIVSYIPAEGAERITGQVSEIDSDRIEIKVIGKPDIFVIIENWIRGYSTGKLRLNIHDSSEITIFNKTIVVKYTYIDLPLLQRFIFWLKGIKVSEQNADAMTYAETWRYMVRRKVKGNVFADGFFIPHPYQRLKSPVYFHHYNKTLTWEQRQMN